jgi:hypothetical protein
MGNKSDAVALKQAVVRGKWSGMGYSRLSDSEINQFGRLS